MSIPTTNNSKLSAVERLARLAVARAHDAPAITAAAAQIHEAALRQSPFLKTANFTQIHPSDLERVFDAYDASFFQGGLRAALAEQGAPLKFGVSQRMTSAGGKTTRRVLAAKGRQPRHASYEISVSAPLLFQTFRDLEHRPITVTGLTCENRLQALQRITEHEIIHLLEMMLWEKSSCAQDQFISLAWRFFAHTKSSHQLITPRERAWELFGLAPGKHARFHFEGAVLRGVVQRITKRATVLVEDAAGQLYSDGKRYRKYYVPLSQLELIEP